MKPNAPPEKTDSAVSAWPKRLIVTLIVVDLIVVIVVIAMVQGPHFGIGVISAIVALGILGTATVTIVTVHAHKRLQSHKSHRASEFAESMGFEHRPGDASSVKQEFKTLPELKSGGTIRNIFEGIIAGRRVVAFEHVHVVHTGSAPVPVMRTIYAAETQSWPRVEIAPNRGLTKLLPKSFGRTRLELDLPEFNRRMRVKAADPDFALTLLSPELQQHILTKPTTTWRIIDGWICLIYNGAMRFDRAGDSMARLERFLELMPQELEYWPSDDL